MVKKEKVSQKLGFIGMDIVIRNVSSNITVRYFSGIAKP